MYRIYTRTGDKGTTALYGGSRIEKDHIRVEAYGTVDELISQLGVCYATTLDAAEKAIAAITRLSMDIGIPQHLRDLGVKEADFPYMAEMALKDGNAFSNPRKGNEQEIAAIFRQAF